jgi:phosphoenolpyruvate phosphomutase
VDEFNHVGIKDVTVVRGFKKEKVKLTNIKTVDNEEYAGTKELYSLYLAKDQIKENTVISYGDIIFKRYVLHELLNDQNNITLVVDADCDENGTDKDFIHASERYDRTNYLGTSVFNKMGSSLSGNEISGEFIGLWKVNAEQPCIDALEPSKKSDFKSMTCSDLFNEIASKNSIAVKYISGAWLDVDTLVDFQNAGKLRL